MLSGAFAFLQLDLTHVGSITLISTTANLKVQTMLKKLLLLASLIGVSLTYAQPITSCRNPEGYAYHHYSGQVRKASSGFTKDRITGGLVTLQKIGDRKYDILFVDAYKESISAIGDGGNVTLLRKGKADATFVHSYPGKIVELYTFWVDTDGQPKYDLVQSKGGDSMLIHKSAIMVGTCSSINFKLID